LTIDKQTLKLKNRLYYTDHKDEINKNRKRYRRQRWAERADNIYTKRSKVVEYFEVNRRASIDELMSVAVINRGSLLTMIHILKGQGHKIKFSFGMYYYGGKK